MDIQWTYISSPFDELGVNNFSFLTVYNTLSNFFYKNLASWFDKSACQKYLIEIYIDP